MTRSPFERRARAVGDALPEHGADAAVCFPSPNLYYVTGFWETPAERHLFGFLTPDDDPVLVVPELYADQVAAESTVRDVRSYPDGADPTELVADLADERGFAGGHLLVDPTMWATFTHDLRETLPDATFGLADDLFAERRVRKDDAELDALRRAGRVADDVLREVRALGSDAVGLTERELAADVERRLAERGGDGVAFEVIVGSGPNGAHPHHTHGDRTIEAGDPVVLDFGTRVDRYPSDQTRTLVFEGEPPDGFEAAFEAVRDAQAAAVDAVEPGVPAAAVDAAARDVVEARGFGEEFVHRTGHGVGLDVHEEPYVVAGNDRSLEPGMVFSVEPGVYRQGEFGVRVEDLVVVTDGGCERLNDTPRGYRV